MHNEKEKCIGQRECKISALAIKLTMCRSYGILKNYRIYLITTSSICFHVNEKWKNLYCCFLCAFNYIFSAFDMKIHLCSFCWLGHNFRIKLYQLQTKLQKQYYRWPYNSDGFLMLLIRFYLKIFTWS